MEKSLGLLDIASVFQDRNSKEGTSCHYATEAKVCKLSLQDLTLKAMINSGSSFNIISQIKITEMDLADGVTPIRKPNTFDGQLLKIHLEYAVSVLTTDYDGKISQDDIQILAADIADLI